MYYVPIIRPSVGCVRRHNKNTRMQIRKKPKSLKEMGKTTERRNDCRETPKVLAARLAAVSPGSFYNPGLLCVRVCVYVCVYVNIIRL